MPRKSDKTFLEWSAAAGWARERAFGL